MQTNQTLKYVLGIIGLAIVLAIGLSFLNNGNSGSHEYDTLASCLTEKGAKFYGAFWCPHCSEQKKLFGASVKLLPYVECSTPDTTGQTQVCIDAKVEQYPTWEFADGTRTSAVMTPAKLAELTGCQASLLGASATTTPTEASTSTVTN